MKNKVFILSIDGGGIRGIIPGLVMAYIEDELNRKSSSRQPIGYRFDLIAGTSTGGILACLYLTGKSAKEAVSLYLQHGAEIFKTSFFAKIKNLFGLAHEKYGAGPLEKHLDAAFGKLMVSDFIRPSLITAYNIHERKAHFFTSIDAREDADQDFMVRDVARATSAAPTYFEPVAVMAKSGKEFQLIDGGVYANNPAICACTEATKIKFSSVLGDESKPDNPKPEDLVILSLGTGSVRKPYSVVSLKTAGAFRWVAPIIDILMSASSETVAYEIDHLYRTQATYYRLEFALGGASGDIDDASDSNLRALEDAAKGYIDGNQQLLNTIVDNLLTKI